MSLIRWVALAGALALGGCAPTSHYLLPTAPSCGRIETSEDLRAHEIKVDITPPVGLSLAGHGIEGRIATGVMTHLYCRGFYFRGRAQPLAWVVCDLNGMSEPIHRRVAEMVQAKIFDLGADRIVLSATHTHSGPGHFHEGTGLESALGGARYPSYDQRLVDFVASRVAGAIVDADSRLEPASLKTTIVPCLRGISRNRAMPAFLLNRTSIDDCDKMDGEHPPDPTHRAVDRSLTVVRVDRKSGRSLGVMAVYGVHNTALPHSNERYAADLFGFANELCEAKLDGGDRRFTCAIANGAEGDVSPDWGTQGEPEARRLGERLGFEIIRAFSNLASISPDPPEIESRYRELVFPNAALDDKSRLCSYPNIGTPSASGAPDGPTRLRIFEQMNPGMVFPEPTRRDCARDRIEVVGISTGTGGSTLGMYKLGWGFASRAPLVMFRLGSQSFLTVPGEPTTMTGRALALAANPGAKADARAATVVGLTDAYLLYFATEREFPGQQYEGASTLYGPKTEPFLRKKVEELAHAQVTSPGPCLVQRAAPAPLATGPEPNGDTVKGPNPDVRSAPVQPPIGAVGDIAIMPVSLVHRWPDGLAVKNACLIRVDNKLEPTPSIRVEAKCEHRYPVVRATWKEPAGARKPLCGVAQAALWIRRHGQGEFRPATIALENPTDASRAWNQLAPHLEAGSGHPIDDSHGYVVVDYDEGLDEWSASYRFVAAAEGDDELAWVITTADGGQHWTHSVKVEGVGPACVERAITNWERLL